MKNKILISGSLAYDYVMNFPGFFRDSFMPDKLHNINVSFYVDARTKHFGGTAGNIAYTLALLGEKAEVISTAGNDFSRYKKHLDDAGADTSKIHIKTDEPTSTAYVFTDHGDNQISAFYPGAGGEAYGVFDPSGAQLAIVAPGVALDMQAMPEYFRSHHVPFFFDPGQQIAVLSSNDLRHGITDSDAVFANDYEFALISQKTEWKEKDMLEHTKMLVVTVGELGSRIVTREGEVLVNAVHSTNVVDPTGAGDAYRAGFIKGYIAGLSPQQCAKLASASAVFAVEAVGAQEHHFTIDELRERFEDAYHEPLTI